MRAACAAAVVAALTVLGLTSVASADSGPVVTIYAMYDTPVILYATIGSSLTLTVDAVPGSSAQPITGVHAVLTAGVIRPGVMDTATADLTSTDGRTWVASIPFTRTASPGSWTVTVTATDAGAAQTTAVSDVGVLLNTHLSATSTPGDPVAGGYMTFYGTLTQMEPATDPTADGRYVPLAGQYVGVDIDRRWADKTDSTGQYRLTVPASSGSFTLAFLASGDYAESSGPTKDITVQAKPTGLATRFSFFDASPEPSYYHAYTHVRGTLQRQDVEGNWHPYAGKIVTIYRHGVGTYQTSATTDSHGNFSATVRGPSATVTGTWHALFVGTINYRASLSHGDHVATIDPPVRITKISADPPGSDSPVTNTKLNEEYITLTNEGTHDANVDQWSVRDKAGHVYLLDSAIYIRPGHSISIHTGAGVNTATQFYWGSTTYIWNNAGDTGYLRDMFQATVDTYTYG